MTKYKAMKLKVAGEYLKVYRQYKQLEKKVELIKQILKKIGKVKYPNGVMVIERERNKLDWNRLKAKIDLNEFYDKVKEMVVIAGGVK